MSAAAVSPDHVWWRRLPVALGGVSLMVVLALWVQGQGLHEIGTTTGALHSVGRLLALLASWLLLGQVLLMARIPFLESGFG